MMCRESSQLTFHSEIYDHCLPSNHPYRQMQWYLDMKRLSKVIDKRYSRIGTTGYAVESAIKMLFVAVYGGLK